MAGAGYRTFTTGQVLTAAQVQTYLQDQTIQTFASSAARSSAIGTAVSAGMHSYRTDEKALEFYTGSAWERVNQAQTAGKNVIINGAFDIWQRLAPGTTSAAFTAGAYVADRWRYDVASAIPTGTISQQTFTPGSAPLAGYEYSYFERFNITAHNGCTNVTHETRIEDVRTLAGQTATLSVWVKADAATTINAIIQQNFGSGGSATTSTVAMAPQAITSSWVRYAVPVNIPSIAGKTIGTGSYLNIQFVLPTSGANVRVGTTDFFGVQLEAGSVATPFSRNASSIQAELAACQRYFRYISMNECQVSASGGNIALGYGFPPMRATPTVAYGMTNANYGTGGWTFTIMGTAAVSKTGTVVLAANSSPDALNIAFNLATWSSTPNGWQNLGSGWITASSEL